jgi:hypothetical protein
MELDSTASQEEEEEQRQLFGKVGRDRSVRTLAPPSNGPSSILEVSAELLDIFHGPAICGGEVVLLHA